MPLDCFAIHIKHIAVQVNVVHITIKAGDIAVTGQGPRAAFIQRHVNRATLLLGINAAGKF